MRHKLTGRKFGRDTAHRKAMLSNLAKSLLLHGKIRTTLPKAKDLRRVVEPIITWGKKGGLHGFRQAHRVLRDVPLTNEVMKTIGPKYQDRAGGYTRIVKDGYRHGDNAPMAIIQLV